MVYIPVKSTRYAYGCQRNDLTIYRIGTIWQIETEASPCRRQYNARPCRSIYMERCLIDAMAHAFVHVPNQSSANGPAGANPIHGRQKDCCLQCTHRSTALRAPITSTILVGISSFAHWLGAPVIGYGGRPFSCWFDFIAMHLCSLPASGGKCTVSNCCWRNQALLTNSCKLPAIRYAKRIRIWSPEKLSRTCFFFFFF